MKKIELSQPQLKRFLKVFNSTDGRKVLEDLLYTVALSPIDNSDKKVGALDLIKFCFNLLEASKRQASTDELRSL